MKNIKIKFEYDGSGFYGFQRQNKREKKRTVQEELEKGLAKLFKQDIDIIASGRTDKGVHAINQVANFYVDNRIPTSRLKRVLNNFTPDDIHIKDLEEAPLDFHARFSAKSRSYIYKMKNRKNFSAFEKNHVTYIDVDLAKSRFLEIANPIIGEYNFESFRMSDCNAKNPVRKIINLDFYKENEEMIFYIEANAFLKSMVRIIVGSILSIYNDKKNENYIIEKLKNPNIKDEKILAPPQGLYLKDVKY